MILASEFRDRVPFARDLGIKLVLAQDGRSRLEVKVMPRLLNSSGFVHGGVMMTLLDVAMAVAARSLESDAAVATVEMKISFMQPGPPQGVMTGSGLCVHRSSSIAFCEAAVRDADDRLLAQALGTFKYFRAAAE